ncbi:transcriptional regulator BetI [Streptomyces scabiei]|uniref:Transcriptional regulator BetI n=1 Tax=Streptomyces scabiei TaxID=1930 RepID=A0A100JNF8_STRSC|nr:transcriptional regulator BetI [Streptomyces scabiei]
MGSSKAWKSSVLLLDSPHADAGRPNARFERRRAETRRALICAARELLAEAGDANAGIQAIVDRADVGLGSFSHHFESKAELFDAAPAHALKEFGQVMDERLAGTGDPAELMAEGFRLVARMADSHPELMRILRHRGPSRIRSDRGLARASAAMWSVGSRQAGLPPSARSTLCPEWAEPYCPWWSCGFPGPTSTARKRPRTWPR